MSAAAIPVIPPAVPAAPRHNLPLASSDLFGREAMLAQVHRLLARVRLLTLVGPGGVGKTRLALAAAEGLLGANPDGAWLIELAPLAEPDLLPAAIAAVLGVREEPGRVLVQTLADYLRDKRLLLLLDNCEHLREACAGLVNTLLEESPGLRVLATSRQPLGIGAERRLAVLPLALPAPGELGPAAVAISPAVALFVARARAVEPTFTLDAANAGAVAAVCARLDGLPLAIELAAARIKVRNPEALVAELEERLRVLVGGRRRLPARQRTVRGLLDWSFTLLGPGEQALFARLSVFAGGWTAAAAQAVCALEGDLPMTAAEGLAALAEQSLVQGPDAGGRYGILETVREYAAYALERLSAAGDAEAVRRNHLAYYLALAEEAAPHLTGPEQVAWLGRLEAEHDNLRAALTRDARGQMLSAAGARLAAALWRFWEVRGHVAEGRRWLEAAVATPHAPQAVLARALGGAGALARMQGDYDHATRLFERRLALGRAQGDRRGVAQALYSLGMVAIDQGNYGRAVALLEESLILARDLGDRWGLLAVTNGLGAVVRLRGDTGRAQALFEESLALAGELGDDSTMALVRNNLGTVARDRGDLDRASVHYEAARALHRQLGNSYHLASTLCNLGELAADVGDAERAVALYREALDLLRAVDDRPHLALCLEGIARCALLRGQPAAGATLLGAAARLRDLLGAPPGPDEQAVLERVIASGRDVLEHAAYAAAAAAGRALSLEEAIALALRIHAQVIQRG